MSATVGGTEVLTTRGRAAPTDCVSGTGRPIGYSAVHSEAHKPMTGGDVSMIVLEVTGPDAALYGVDNKSTGVNDLKSLRHAIDQLSTARRTLSLLHEAEHGAI